MLDERVDFVVPTLHYWEFANVLRTHVRNRAFDRKLAEEIWMLHLDAPLQVVEPPIDSVFRLSLEHGATAYDAVFLALVVHLDVPLLTAERPTTSWMARLGKRVVSLLR